MYMSSVLIEFAPTTQRVQPFNLFNPQPNQSQTIQSNSIPEQQVTRAAH